MLHVVPINDLHEHEDSTACACRPEVDWDLPVPVCVHNAWDGRELIEQAQEISDHG